MLHKWIDETVPQQHYLSKEMVIWIWPTGHTFPVSDMRNSAGLKQPIVERHWVEKAIDTWHMCDAGRPLEPGYASEKEVLLQDILGVGSGK